MAATRITVNNNGSVRVEGDFELCDQDGNVVSMPGVARISLCRCGHSANKPFCDGAHKAAGFSSPITAATMNPPKPKPAL
jgi:CDGSH-type Zn-finger protein